MTLYIYGVLAVFFAKHFSPPGNDNLALLASLPVFWFGFTLRPFGAIFFGHLGDLIGRKFTFMRALGMMGLATFLIGLHPSYETWGIAAPILILLMRAMQGLALGDEYGGAATYIAERAPDGRHGLYASWIQSSPQRSAPYSSGTTLSLRDAGTALPRNDEALKIKFLK
jgi:MFS family permease